MSDNNLSSQELAHLQNIAQNIRVEIIKMISQAGSGHPAGSLGMADILTALYFQILNHKPDEPSWPERDYVLLSNGHICPVLYATLALAGYFDSALLNSLRQLNSPLQGHPKYQSLPGIENNSGPLGQSLSQACGLALALRHDQQANHIYCLLSDGEQQEGQTWEAYMLGAKYNLKNITAIIDRNLIQIGGKTEEIMPVEDLSAKITAFGWQVYLINGHNFSEIVSTLDQAKQDGQPSVIIAKTVPGKGVSFMEHKSKWHGKAPSQEEAEQALQELA